MKRTNKKGFTIVELVIVIAVIAILAAVLIPNLSRLVTKADKSAAMQEAKAAMDNDLINAEGDLANMTKYVVAENDSDSLKGKQVYVNSTADAESATAKFVGTTANGVTTLTTAGDGATAPFYDVTAYEGKYTGTTESGTYEYTTKDQKFVCKLVTGGEWVITEAGN